MHQGDSQIEDNDYIDEEQIDQQQIQGQQQLHPPQHQKSLPQHQDIPHSFRKPKFPIFDRHARSKFVLSPNQDLFLMNIDFSTSSRLKQRKSNRNQYPSLIQTQSPVINIYALTAQGNSLQVNVMNFLPFFYAQIPERMSPASDFQPLRQEINKLHVELQKLSLSQGTAHSKFFEREAVTDIRVVKKCSIYGYVSDEAQRSNYLLRVECCNPAAVSRVVKIFEEERIIAEVKMEKSTYESNVNYILRFMVEKDIVGMGWFKVAGGSYKHIDKCSSSYCQAEIDVDVKDLQAVECSGQYTLIAPLRLFSFDIECACKVGFPNANTNPVIQIACVGKLTDRSEEDFKIVLALNGASPVSGVQIVQFTSEEQMLLAFQYLLQTYDPDILLGYNIISFDLCYLLNRAIELKIKKYGQFGRNRSKISRIKKSVLRSKQMGKRQTKQINIDGRIQFDLLLHMLRQHKLSSYTLSNVSSHFLKEQKEGVHHSQIYKLFMETRDTRRRLAVYCLKDAQLPLRLFTKLCCVYNYAEMARVTGVPLTFLLTRGQQIKVISQLLRKTKQHSYVLPTLQVRANAGQIGYDGAYVLEPQTGYYTNPIATLDFASLYPSIMIAHNLCYTTILTSKQAKDLDESQYEKCPIEGFLFVKENLRKGLLPQILTQLISARKKAKKDLAMAKDEMLRNVLEGRQLALKISANSVYGFTGATIGQLPCLAISSSVTAYGRTMIDQTRSKVMDLYPDARVIYGDTDSVMVKFNVMGSRQQQIRQALRIGKEAAETITRDLFSGLKSIKLQFQKVYCPYLLISKKRYAGLYYTRQDRYDKIDKKGLESVRRDNCLLIREMLDKVLEMLLCQNDKNGIIDYIRKAVSDLVQNKLDISQLVITKAMSKDEQGYKNKQPHVQLAEKMKQRDANVVFSIGDRISYVIISGSSKSKNYQNAEDPLRVVEQELSIDYDYYINTQLKPPLKRLLQGPKIISNFDALFCGDHTKLRYSPPMNKNVGIGKYLKVAPSCANCLTLTNKILCDKCAMKDIEVTMQREMELDILKAEFNKLWTECQSCQSSLLMNIICQNNDCLIFYKRNKVKKELQKKRILLQKIKTWGNQF